MVDFLPWLGRAYLAAMIGIVAVLVCREPMRRILGSQAAYRLWISVPLAIACTLLPRRTLDPAPVANAIRALAQGAAPARPLVAPPAVVAVWLVGAAAAAALLAWRGRQDVRRAKQTGPLPIVVGAVSARIVAPDDLETRFTSEQRALLRVQAQAQIDRWASRLDAAWALARALNWFNPLVHLAARLASLDQQLACDAVAVAGRSGAAAYAQLLAGSPAAPSLLQRCAPTKAYARTVRSRRLALGPPGRGRGRWALPATALFLLATGSIVWLSQPIDDAGQNFPSKPAFARALETGSPPPRLRIVDAAVRVVVIPEARRTIQASISLPGRGLPTLRLTRVDGGLVIDGSLAADMARPGHRGDLSCERTPGGGVAVRLRHRLLGPGDLPVVVVRTPFDVRIWATGAVFGDIGPGANVAFVNDGCGDWTIGPVSNVLALLNAGTGDIHAVGQGRLLAAAEAGPGSLAIDRGEVFGANLENTGAGRLVYGGAANSLVASTTAGGDVLAGIVYGLDIGSLMGSGRICSARPSEGRTCVPGPDRKPR